MARADWQFRMWRALLGTSGSAGDVPTFVSATSAPTWQAPAGGPGGSTDVAQGTVSFGSTENDYAEVTIAATWVTSSHRIMVSVRGGTADHPIGDEDATIEELRAAVVAVTEGTSITVGVHAPNTTTGQYLVDILGAA